MKKTVVVDVQYIFDADNSVWDGSRDFEKTQEAIVKSMGGESQVLLKSVLSERYAKYVFSVEKTKEEEIAEISARKPVVIKNKK